MLKKSDFGSLIEDLKDIDVSIEILDDTKSALKKGTAGTNHEQYAIINKLIKSMLTEPARSIVYDGLKYIFVRCIEQQGKPLVYIFVSFDFDKNNKKRGMLITSIKLALIFTFDNMKMKPITAKIINVLDQYLAELN